MLPLTNTNTKTPVYYQTYASQTPPASSSLQQIPELPKENLCDNQKEAFKIMGRLQRVFQGKGTTEDLPQALRSWLLTIPEENESKRTAAAVAFWLKHHAAHSNDEPSATIFLILQTCVLLKKHGYRNSINELWLLIKFGNILKPNTPFLHAIVEVMDEGPAAFEALIFLFEARACLAMFATAQPPGYWPKVVMHDSSRALQIQFKSQALLIPYHPPAAYQALDEIYRKNQKLAQLLHKIDADLQPQGHPYIARNEVTSEIPIPMRINNETFFTQPLGMFTADWHMVCWLRKIIPIDIDDITTFLFNITLKPDSKEISKRLLQSASELEIDPLLAKLFRKMAILMDDEFYSKAPIQLQWAMAYAFCWDTAFGLKAFQLWQRHSSQLDGEIKTPFAAEFMRNLKTGRPDLTVEVFGSLVSADYPAAEGWKMFKSLLWGFDINDIPPSLKICQLLAKTQEKLVDKLSETDKKEVAEANATLVKLLQKASTINLYDFSLHHE